MSPAGRSWQARRTLRRGAHALEHAPLGGTRLGERAKVARARGSGTSSSGRGRRRRKRAGRARIGSPRARSSRAAPGRRGAPDSSRESCPGGGGRVLPRDPRDQHADEARAVGRQHGALDLARARALRGVTGWGVRIRSRGSPGVRARRAAALARRRRSPAGPAPARGERPRRMPAPRADTTGETGARSAAPCSRGSRR